MGNGGQRVRKLEQTADRGCEPGTEHGGNIYKIAAELDVAEGTLIDFSASINPLGISLNVKEAIRKEMDRLVHYPDPDTTKLRQILSLQHNVDPETVICGNGSTELIYLVPRALRPGKILIPFPTFSEYERACTLRSDARVTGFALKKENNFGIHPPEFIDAMQGCDMAFLCNPNNPTGARLSREKVLEIAAGAGKARCMLVVDEAFIDFCPEASVIHDVAENPCLSVLRSMTKFYALPGLRVGYGVFHREVIGRLEQYKEPWTVNNFAQKAAIAALQDNVYAEETFILMKEEKTYLENSFRERGIEFFPSAANYYLLEVGNGGRVVHALRKKGVLVRDCSNFEGLGNSFIRVAVKSRKENERLIKGLSEL